MTHYHVIVDGEEYLVTLEGPVVTALNGSAISASLVREPGTSRVIVTCSDDTFRLTAARNGNRYEVAGGGRTFDVHISSGHDRFRNGLGSSHDTGGVGELRAPMPALVRGIPVSEGDPVTEGQTLVILEAMKMENDVRASRSGKIGSIAVRSGMTVENDQLLLTIE